MANEQDICNADLYFTELETDLQMDINNTATNYPGYDGYRYNIGEISHSPYELMGYLSIVFNAFNFDEIKGVIERLFGEQYQLTRTEVIESGRHILQTTLTVKPLSEIIAAVGSTGQSIGPHLHLEVMLDGEYLNLYYFVDTGEDGTSSTVPGVPGGPTIPDYPGEPPTDDTFAAMLAEAEKYLGYPYVWGDSSPSTSFDCSGFVSWVINHSGWDVGRLGAQRLYNICTPVSAADVQPGDLVFFWHTYDALNPNGVTHVGIYVGNGQMIHCGKVRPDRTEVEVEERRTEKGPTP